MDEYSGVDVQNVTLSDDIYRIFDKPAQSKMMVTSSVSSAAAQGFAQGATFGAIDSNVPRPLFEAAARQFLVQTSRASCRVTDVYLLVRPQWEAKYDCTPPAATAPLRQESSAQHTRAAPPVAMKVQSRNLH